MRTCFSLIIVLLFALPLFSQNTLNNAGLTAASPSSAAFSLRKLSRSYTGPAIKVRRSSDIDLNKSLPKEHYYLDISSPGENKKTIKVFIE